MRPFLVRIKNKCPSSYKLGRTLFKQAGIYYDGTNAIIKMLSNGNLIVLSKRVAPIQLFYKCRNLLDTSMTKGREVIVTAKEFEQGIKTGLNKLSEQDIKQIRDEFNSEPDYPIPSQNPKK